MVDEVVSGLGGVDILVNNAAVYPRRAWTEIEEEEWDRVMAVNLKGYFLCARAVYPHMKERGRGSIVNVASITFFIGWTLLLDYVASKGGIVGFTRTLAREVGPDNINVNAIAPGAFPTDAEKIHPDQEGYNRWVLERAEHQAPRNARRHRRPRRVPRLRLILLHNGPDHRHRRWLDDALSRGGTVAEPATAKRERKEKLEDILVVDCDVHVHESPEALMPFCEMPWQKALETIKDVKEFYLDIPGFSPGTTVLRSEVPFGRGPPAWSTPPPRCARSSTRSTWTSVSLFPDHFLKIPVISQVDYASALARAYNAWLLAEWCSPENGLLGCILACPQDPVGAAREIEKYSGEKGMVGVFLPCAGLERLWGHRQYDPIYEAAQEADLPVLMHSVTVIHPVFPFNTQGFETEFGRHICSHTFSMMANIVQHDDHGGTG